MSKNKKMIIGILIAILIIVIGVVILYKLIEKNITNREDFKVKIENISSNPVETVNVKDFEILFKNRQPIDSYNKVYPILDKSETNKYDYTIYAYDGRVNIRIDDKDYSLKEALLENKITMDEIIEKANEDLAEEKITGDMFKDGGSMIYQYSNYTIIKCHTLDGNRDVYIGTKNMTINDIYK